MLYCTAPEPLSPAQAGVWNKIYFKQDSTLGLGHLARWEHLCKNPAQNSWEGDVVPLLQELAFAQAADSAQDRCAYVY